MVQFADVDRQRFVGQRRQRELSHIDRLVGNVDQPGAANAGLAGAQCADRAQVAGRPGRVVGQVRLVDVAQQPGVECGALELAGGDRRMDAVGLVAIAVQQADARPGAVRQRPVGQRRSGDAAAGKRPADDRTGRQVHGLPPAAAAEQFQAIDVIGQPRQHVGVVVAGDRQHPDASASSRSMPMRSGS